MGQHVRGDVTFAIGEETYTVKPSFKAIAAIESITGMGMIELMQAVTALRPATITTILFHALRASDHTVDFEVIGEAVMDTLADRERGLNKAASDYLAAFFPKADTGKKPQAASAAITG